MRSESEIIQEILHHYPENDRTRIRALYEDRSGVILSERPELKALSLELSEVRQRMGAPAQEALERARREEEAELSRRIRVSVALVPDMVADTAVAVVRQPDDGGRPLVVMYAGATAIDLAFGLGEAARSVADLGERVGEPHRRPFSHNDVRESFGADERQEESAARLLGYLRIAKISVVPGVGQARLMKIDVPRRR